MDRNGYKHIDKFEEKQGKRPPGGGGGGKSHTWPDGDARPNLIGVEIVDPVAFRVSGRKNLHFELKLYILDRFWDVTSQYPFMYRIACKPLAIIFNIPVLFLMKISKVTFRE